MIALADHFPTGCWWQPDDSYAGQCSCGHTFIGGTYTAAKQAWATHATTPGGDLLEQAARTERSLSGVIAEAKRTLRLVQGCMECNADDERRWSETIEWLERLA